MLDRRTGLVALFTGVVAFVSGWFVRGMVDASVPKSVPPAPICDSPLAVDSSGPVVPDGAAPLATLDANTLRLRVVGRTTRSFLTRARPSLRERRRSR